MSGDIVSILDFGVVEWIGELEPSSRDFDIICPRNSHILFAGIVKNAYSNVIDYVSEGWYVVRGSCDFDLTTDFIQSHVNLRNST